MSRTLGEDFDEDDEAAPEIDLETSGPVGSGVTAKYGGGGIDFDDELGDDDLASNDLELDLPAHSGTLGTLARGEASLPPNAHGPGPDAGALPPDGDHSASGGPLRFGSQSSMKKAEALGTAPLPPALSAPPLSAPPISVPAMSAAPPSRRHAGSLSPVSAPVSAPMSAPPSASRLASAASAGSAARLAAASATSDGAFAGGAHPTEPTHAHGWADATSFAAASPLGAGAGAGAAVNEAGARPTNAAAIIARYPPNPTGVSGAPMYALRVALRQYELNRDLVSLRRRRSPDVALYEAALEAHDKASFRLGVMLNVAAFSVATFLFFLPVLLRFMRAD